MDMRNLSSAQRGLARLTVLVGLSLLNKVSLGSFDIAIAVIVISSIVIKKFLKRVDLGAGRPRYPVIPGNHSSPFVASIQLSAAARLSKCAMTVHSLSADPTGC